MKSTVKNKDRYPLWKKLFLKIYKRFLKIRGEPKAISLGFALGIFIGMTPTMGLQLFIVTFLAAVFKWNKISSIIGVFITNPLTAPFIYYFNYQIGANILGVLKKPPVIEDMDFSLTLKLFQNTPKIFKALTVGGVITGIPCAIIGYYVAYSLIVKYRTKKQLKINKLGV